MSALILVVEDDVEIASVVTEQLLREGFTTETATDGQRGLELALSGNYALVVLDLNLPSLSGIEICKAVRAAKLPLPILMLTARTDEIDKIIGLELGADDYITKPFSVREFSARVKALLRRINEAAPPQPSAAINEVFDLGDLVVDLAEHKVSVFGNVIELTSTEFDLLAFFAANPGRIFTREQLLTSVWGYSGRGYERSVNTIMSRLRGKIERDPENPRFIQTIRGVGYRLNRS